MVPPAPPKFSITIVWPRTSPNRAPKMRATVSEALPAANGTIIETDRSGQFCAGAAVAVSAARASEQSRRRAIMGSPIEKSSNRRISIALGRRVRLLQPSCGALYGRRREASIGAVLEFAAAMAGNLHHDHARGGERLAKAVWAGIAKRRAPCYKYRVNQAAKDILRAIES